MRECLGWLFSRVGWGFEICKKEYFDAGWSPWNRPESDMEGRPGHFISFAIVFVHTSFKRQLSDAAFRIKT
jgi:hypothetical protein